MKENSKAELLRGYKNRYRMGADMERPPIFAQIKGCKFRRLALHLSILPAPVGNAGTGIYFLKGLINEIRCS